MEFTGHFLNNDYTLKVSPEKMYEKASQLEALVERLDSVFMLGFEIVKRTDTYWSGDRLGLL